MPRRNFRLIIVILFWLPFRTSKNYFFSHTSFYIYYTYNIYNKSVKPTYYTSLHCDQFLLHVTVRITKQIKTNQNNDTRIIIKTCMLIQFDEPRGIFIIFVRHACWILFYLAIAVCGIPSTAVGFKNTRPLNLHKEICKLSLYLQITEKQNCNPLHGLPVCQDRPEVLFRRYGGPPRIPQISASQIKCWAIKNESFWYFLIQIIT